MASESDHIIIDEDRRLVQLALAAGEVSSLPCLDVADLALLVDSRGESGAYLSESRQEELWNHLAHCPTCYEQWRIIAEVQQQTVKKRSLAKIISITGGVLAAAASILLFVNIRYAPLSEMAPDKHFPVVELLSSSPADLESPGQEEQAAADTVSEFSRQSRETQMLQARKVEQVAKRAKVARSARKEMVTPPPLPVLKSAPSELDEVQSPTLQPRLEDLFGLADQEQTHGEILLDINRLIPTVLQKMQQGQVGDVVEVKTYKRDRGFTVEKRADDQVLIRQYGFNNREFTVPVTALKKNLKTLVKAEFSRSNKVWLRSASAPLPEKD